ncbi:MAG: PSD1 and planctomycete cytochrome C domain-containing protein [Planctomycetota bacterium]
MKSLLLPLSGLALAAAALLPQPTARPADEPPIDFARDVRPILAEKCVLCHGPDENDREADLRLDERADVFADRGGYAAVVAGDAAASELFLRVTDELDPMPPESADAQLTEGEIDVLRRWIDEGAGWSEHWAYVAPRRGAKPEVSEELWLRDPLDRFVLARLDAEGLAPAPEATRTTLLRRAALDLTGLPPTVEEVDAFLADGGPGAYGRAVDRLLASPRYGEHMTRYWLDAARYGDTHGFHLDNERALWRWRDWVIEAFNDNKPFDEFTVEQLAGDLLPEPTVDQLIATGFSRCNPTTGEGGLIADEYLVKYAVDRVETTSTVFLGSTLGCASCHDHKYDPFTQREFYRLFAFFNSLDEEASDRNALTPPPSIEAPLPQQTARLTELGEAITAAEAALVAPNAELDAAQTDWEERWAADLGDRWHPLEPLSATAREGATLTVLDDASVLASGDNPPKEVYEVLAQTDATLISALHVEALRHESMANGGVGRATNANIVLSKIELEVVPAGRSGAFEPVAFASAYADFAQPDYPADGAIDDDPETGWGVHKREAENHQATFVLAKPLRLERGAVLRARLRFESLHQMHTLGRFRLSVSTEPGGVTSLSPWFAAGPFPAASADEAYATDYGPEAGLDLSARYPGGVRWEARPDFVDGVSQTFTGDNTAYYVARTIHAPAAQRMGLALGSDDALKVWLNGEVVLDRNVRRPLAPAQDRVMLALPAGDSHLVMKVVNAGGGFGFHFEVESEELFDLPFAIARAVSVPLAERSADEAALLRREYRRGAWPAFAGMERELAELTEQRAAVQAAIPRTMIMRERAMPRPTHVLVRGQYDRKGEEVQAGVPGVLPPLPDGAPSNRLGLARWLVDPAHPLTARVTVNRFWQQIFGAGLVETPEDFGTRGSWPTHPQLLDELALDFIESGWDVKALLRRFVTSAAYRQAATVTPAKLERDPANALLSRGTRHRLDAERIRDGALFLGGLLVERLGGPSVRPYQPAGLWKAVGYTSSNTANFKKDSGEGLYRRSLYTFWKRTSPPPTMSIFDAPTREACTVRRARTNTPLQALALMNDVQFVEAARGFAERLLRSGPTEPDERLAYAFRAATSRAPQPEELAVLRATLDGHLSTFAADSEGARALLAVGDSVYDASLPAEELAAWTMLANLLLNLDEVVTRG